MPDDAIVSPASGPGRFKLKWKRDISLTENPFPFRGISANLKVPKSYSLPFKGRVGVGMGEDTNATAPIPLLASPLKGEELGTFVAPEGEGVSLICINPHAYTSV